MTDEQITVIAKEVFPGFEELQDVFIQGAQFERENRDRDEEIEDLKHQVRKAQKERDIFRSAFSILNNNGRWVSVKERKPTKPTPEEGIKQTLIAYWEDAWMFDVMYYEDADEAWHIEGRDWMPEYQYWMPITQPKGDKK